MKIQLAIVCAAAISAASDGATLREPQGVADGAADDVEIPDVVVTARPLRPDAVVIDREEIASSPGESLADVLSWSGVIDVYRRGSGQAQADLGFRASTFEQTGVFVDGIPLRSPQTGHFLLDLPLGRGQLEAIEVSPLSWGPDGVAGSVNVRTKPPTASATDVELAAGTFGTWRTGVGTTMPGVGIWTSFEHSDGYRHDTDYDVGSVAALFGSEDLSSRGMVAWSKRSFGANDFYGPFSTYDEWEETKTFLATWSGRTDAGPWTIEPSLSYRRHHDHFILDLLGASSYENTHTSDTLSESVAFARDLPAGRLRLTVEGRTAGLESSALGERDWSAGGVSGMFDSSGGRFESTIGLRADAHSRYALPVCPLASVKWRPSDGFALRASASRAFREPSFTDLYYPGLANVGNPDLGIESSWNLDLAAEWRSDGIEASAGLFARWEDNLIDWVKDAVPDPWESVNIDESTVLGAETRVTLRRPLGRVAFSYAYLNRDADHGGKLSKYAANFPEHRLEARGSLVAGPWRASARLGWFARTDGQKYALLDGGVTWMREGTDVFVTFTNLLDEDYEEVGGVPMPGRGVTVGTRSRF